MADHREHSAPSDRPAGTRRLGRIDADLSGYTRRDHWVCSLYGVCTSLFVLGMTAALCGWAFVARSSPLGPLAAAGVLGTAALALVGLLLLRRLKRPAARR